MPMVSPTRKKIGATIIHAAATRSSPIRSLIPSIVQLVINSVAICVAVALPTYHGKR